MASPRTTPPSSTTETKKTADRMPGTSDPPSGYGVEMSQTLEGASFISLSLNSAESTALFSRAIL